jgi:hypothetical protein
MAGMGVSVLFNKALEHHFAARFVKIDTQLIAIDKHNRAIAKFLMKDD